MKKSVLLAFLLLTIVTNAISQNNVGIGILMPDPSSALDVSSTNKGVLIPRMTTNQRDLIATPANGLMIYNVDSNCLNYYKSNQWMSICDEINNAVNNAMPCGSIIMWGGNISQIPTGWYLCDGTNNTPDLRDKFIRGSSGTSDHLTSGGADQVTLTVNQLPAHTHAFSGQTNLDGAHEHSFWAGNGSGGGAFDKGDNDDERGYHHPNNANISRHRHNFSGVTNTTGTGEVIPILPSYYKLAYIKKCN